MKHNGTVIEHNIFTVKLIRFSSLVLLLNLFCLFMLTKKKDETHEEIKGVCISQKYHSPSRIYN